MQYVLSLINEPGILHNNAEVYLSNQTGYMLKDLELVKTFKSGDQSAFVELVKKYKDRIFRLAYSMLQDKDEAEDITQEVFLKVYYKITSYREQSAFFTWLYRIAVNQCHNAARKRNRIIMSLDAPLGDDESEKISDMLKSGEKDNETRLAAEEQTALLNRLIATLPDKYRTMYVLRNIDGLSYGEISGIMKIPVSSVKIGLFRAREKMDTIIKPLCGAAAGENK